MAEIVCRFPVPQRVDRFGESLSRHAAGRCVADRSSRGSREATQQNRSKQRQFPREKELR
jgi:hypothetical protein